MIRLLTGDCRDVLKTLPAESAHCVVTSPPYFGLRDYGVAGQIGLEPTPAEYVAELVAVFDEVRRVLRADGTLWLNLGDSYAGSWGAQSRTTPVDGISASQIAAHPKLTLTGSMTRFAGLKPKDLIGIPWRVAFALQAAGWWLRQDIIWSKPNPMPESVTDRCTKAHEYLFLLARSERYYFDAAAIAEPAVAADIGAMDGGAQRALNGSNVNAGRNFRNRMVDAVDPPRFSRNKRTVWDVATSPFAEAHFATFPPALIEPCILAGCPKGGVVLDPFAGAGTTGLVADRLGRNALLIELNPAYGEMAGSRIVNDAPLFVEFAR